MDEIERLVLEAVKDEPLPVSEVVARVRRRRSDVINAIKRLESRGLVRTFRRSNRKYVQARVKLPKWLVVLAALTLLAVPASVLPIHCRYVLSFNGTNVVYVYPYPLFLISYLLGLWTASLALRWSDVEELISGLLIRLRNGGERR